MTCDSQPASFADRFPDLLAYPDTANQRHHRREWLAAAEGVEITLTSWRPGITGRGDSRPQRLGEGVSPFPSGGGEWRDVPAEAPSAYAYLADPVSRPAGGPGPRGRHYRRRPCAPLFAGQPGGNGHADRRADDPEHGGHSSGDAYQRSTQPHAGSGAAGHGTVLAADRRRAAE